MKERFCKYCNRVIAHGKWFLYCSEQCRYKYMKELKPKHKMICEQCNTEFETVIKNQKYCSYSCSSKANSVKRIRPPKIKKCPYCNKEFETKSNEKKFCSLQCSSRFYGEMNKKYYKCQHCGELFWRDSAYRASYCSRKCAIDAKFGTKEEREQKKKALKAEKGTAKQCVWCNKEFKTTFPQKQCCSNECSYNYQRQKDRNEWEETRVERAAKHIPDIFACKECGSVVSTQYGERKTSYCSVECQEKDHQRQQRSKRDKQMRKAFRAPVTFQKIYKRDAGICGICGLFVPLDKTPTNLWGATIDHIIPISQGGTHEPSNCQLAHRICNSIKQDTVDEFTIDWNKRNSEENGRWSPMLKEYDEMIFLLTKEAK